MNSFSGVNSKKYYIFHYYFSCLESSLNYTFDRCDLSFLEKEIWAILWE